jgi:hypothetical protein
MEAQIQFGRGRGAHLTAAERAGEDGIVESQQQGLPRCAALLQSRWRTAFAGPV